MALSASDLSTLSRLLDEALELPAGELEAWLYRLPASDARLVPELREMLAERTRSSSFLALGPALDADETIACIGDRVGPYRLIREIGRGGMGAVWLAEQVDGRLSRKVALKLPRLAWGSGLKERMARERDIGALLEHPNIARLYDAGVDERGRPYLALEYIDGMPLDRWCVEQKLPIDGRLKLFLQVAQAVAYAHGRLVVHRDLKPSNVLVAADGQARLLDFGIAKLLDDVSPGAALTQEQGRVLTPDYASPEQLRGETITVASDVYSLGVLLHELLTGARPPRPQSHGTAPAGLEPAAPAASSRVADPSLARRLRGELDAIVGKALDPDPQRRYLTADALADDVRRHLSGERVAARPDTLSYRVGKILRRHWVAFGAAAAVLVAVLAGSSIALVQAERALRSAERERLVKEFVSELFRASSRGEGAEVRHPRSSSDLLLENGARLIETRFPGQPALQAELFGVVGEVFTEMGAYALAADYSAKQLQTLKLADADSNTQERATYRYAESLFRDNRYLQALSVAEAALPRAADPTAKKDLLVLIARIQFSLGRSPQSDATATRARDIATSPSVADAWLVWLEAEKSRRLDRDSEFVDGMRRAIALATQVEGTTSPTAGDMQLTLLTD